MASSSLPSLAASVSPIRRVDESAISDADASTFIDRLVTDITRDRRGKPPSKLVEETAVIRRFNMEQRKLLMEIIDGGAAEAKVDYEKIMRDLEVSREDPERAKKNLESKRRKIQEKYGQELLKKEVLTSLKHSVDVSIDTEKKIALERLNHLYPLKKDPYSEKRIEIGLDFRRRKKNLKKLFTDAMMNELKIYNADHERQLNPKNINVDDEEEEEAKESPKKKKKEDSEEREKKENEEVIALKRELRRMNRAYDDLDKELKKAEDNIELLEVKLTWYGSHSQAHATAAGLAANSAQCLVGGNIFGSCHDRLTDYLAHYVPPNNAMEVEEEEEEAIDDYDR